MTKLTISIIHSNIIKIVQFSSKYISNPIRPGLFNEKQANKRLAKTKTLHYVVFCDLQGMVWNGMKDGME